VENQKWQHLEGEAFRRISSSGSVKTRGSNFYRTTPSSDKLAFLNNVVGVFEAEVDPEGNFRENLGMEVAGSYSLF
jgi:hypothetical protein